MKSFTETVEIAKALNILFPFEVMSLNVKPAFIQLVGDSQYIEPIRLALEAAGVAVEFRPHLERSLFLTFPLDHDYPYDHPKQDRHIRKNLFVRSDLKHKYTLP